MPSPHRARRLPRGAVWCSTLSGMMIGSTWLCFVPPWLLPIAFVPLWLAWTRATRASDVLRTGWIAQLAASLIGFSWIAPTVRDWGETSLTVGVLAWLLAACVANAHIPLVGWAWQALRTPSHVPGIKDMLLLVALALGVEAITPKVLPFHYGYPWMWSGLPLLQLADVLGAAGLAVFTYGANGLLTLAWLRRHTAPRHALAWAAASVALLSLGCLAGTARQAAWLRTDRAVSVRLIQMNHPIDQARAAREGHPYREHVLDAYFALSRDDASSSVQPDVLIWPEGALPFSLADGIETGYSRRLRSFARDATLPLITGAYGLPVAEAERSNLLVMFDANGDTAGVHVKHRLFPVGEEIPGAALLRRLWVANRPSAPVAAARAPGAIEVAGVRFGPSICYDGLFPDLGRALVESGAQVLVNVSSDYRFGATIEPYQHLYMTTARAVELRRPMIRLAQSGFSSVVLASGEEIVRSPLGAQWQATLAVPYLEAPPATWFAQHGQHLQWLWLGLVLTLSRLFAPRARVADTRVW
jgi:apolipoprotein N-acyltransferase